jgi:hypothetical protein
MGSAPGFWDGLRWSAASFSSFFFCVWIRAHRALIPRG